MTNPTTLSCRDLSPAISAAVYRGRVLLMPQGVTRAELDERGPWVAEACKRHGFRYCPRLHIELYGHRRGT